LITSARIVSSAFNVSILAVASSDLSGWLLAGWFFANHVTENALGFGGAIELTLFTSFLNVG
jgi:hypothetical protein